MPSPTPDFLFPSRQDLSRDRGFRRIIAATVLLGIAFPLLWTLVTRQVWEDFLITFRQSRHAAEGLGLVYNEGSRVFGFTSPLNGVLPALWHWLFPSPGFHGPLAFFSVLVVLASVLGLVAVVHTFWRASLGHQRWLAVGVPLLALLQVKTTAFSVNGQKAGFIIGFLGLGFAAAGRGFGKHPLAKGVAWAGLFWTRPDAPVYILALVAGGLAFNGFSCNGEAVGLGWAALVCTGLYLRWFAWSWVYYGSPIPHTILAKRGMLAEMLGGQGVGVTFFPLSPRYSAGPSSLSTRKLGGGQDGCAGFHASVAPGVPSTAYSPSMTVWGERRRLVSW